jgi:hypothetical protein
MRSLIPFKERKERDRELIGKTLVLSTMQKLGISLLFFTLCLPPTSFAHSSTENRNPIPNLDSLLTHLHLDSLLRNFDFASILKVTGGVPNVDSILHQVNVDSIMHSVNIDSIMHRVNVDSIMHRVNIDSIMKRVNIDSIMKRVNIDSIMKRVNIDSLWKTHKPAIDSLRRGFGSLNPRLGHLKNSASAKISPHYFSMNGERYYIDILPPKQKATRVDSSRMWLLGMK